MHDMEKMQNEDKTQPRRESHNLKPEMAEPELRMWQITSGALHSPTTNIGSVSVHQTVRLHIKKHATIT